MDSSQKIMRLMTGDELWPTISKHSKAATSTRAAISYFTSDTYLHFNAGDVLIIDASDHAIEKGQTSAKTGANVFLLTDETALERSWPSHVQSHEGGDGSADGAR
jgi:hypothetical protein